MEHKGTVVIETERLVLRRFKIDDSEAAFKNWTSDAKVTEFLRWPAHESLETTKKVLEMWIEDYNRNDFYQWAIILKSEGDLPVGSISVVEQNEDLGILHIGYCIGQKWWNRGLTSEAYSAIIPFLFEQVKANRIESQHDPENPNSGRVMLKCGMVFEGTFHQKDRNNRGIVDASMYRLLASEYDSR